MPAKNMPGRKAGEDHARSQGPLRGEAFVGSTLSLAALSGFTVFKRTAVLSSVQRSAFFYKRVLPALSGSLLLSVQRIFRARSRAGASRDDCLFLLHVILALFRPVSHS